ncbi:MAG: ABC transporter permease [Microbacteriaceae bacterium]
MSNETIVTGPILVTAKKEKTKSYKQWLTLAPVIFLFLLFFFYPLYEVLVRSITFPEVGMQNFAWLFEEQVNMTVLIRTFQTSFWVTVICLLFAYPYTYFLTTLSGKAKAVLFTIVLIPFWTSGVIRTFAWVILLQDSGPLGDFFRMFGVESLGVLRTNTAVFIGMAQVLLPFFILPLYANLSKIDLRLLTAAQSLGARPSRAFFKVYLPLSFPGIAAGSILTFVLALGFYITPAMLGSPREALLSTLIQGKLEGHLQWGQVAVLSLLLLVSTMLILLIAGMISKRTSMKVSDMIGGSKA